MQAFKNTGMRPSQPWHCQSVVPSWESLSDSLGSSRIKEAFNIYTLNPETKLYSWVFCDKLFFFCFFFQNKVTSKDHVSELNEPMFHIVKHVLKVGIIFYQGKNHLKKIGRCKNFS